MLKGYSAFTMVELIIAIVIIGILAVTALISYGPLAENARQAEAYSILNEIVSAEKRYYADKDNYTMTITDLDSFSSIPASDNFTFSVPSDDSSAGYAQAARKSSAAGRKSYGMCLDSGKRADCFADACDPSCP